MVLPVDSARVATAKSQRYLALKSGTLEFWSHIYVTIDGEEFDLTMDAPAEAAPDR
jgi:CTP synthase (UTP-ammonia lyase)